MSRMASANGTRTACAQYRTATTSTPPANVTQGFTDFKVSSRLLLRCSSELRQTFAVIAGSQQSTQDLTPDLLFDLCPSSSRSRCPERNIPACFKRWRLEQRSWLPTRSGRFATCLEAPQQIHLGRGRFRGGWSRGTDGHGPSGKTSPCAENGAGLAGFAAPGSNRGGSAGLS